MLHVDTIVIWDYGTRASYTNLLRLGVICFAIFATFIAFGIIVSVLLGRAREGVSRIYFSDLIGAGLGCVLAIPLITRLGPPRVIMLAALIFALVGLASCRPKSALFGFAVLVSAGAGGDGRVGRRAARHPHRRRQAAHAEDALHGVGARCSASTSSNSARRRRTISSSTTAPSDPGIRRFDGNPASIADYYAKDPRSIPFDVLGNPPPHELIIGSAGGNEILASLANHVPDIEAVELNPVTVSLLTNHFADYTGHLTKRPDVHLHLGDGRSYLARHKTKYNLVWYVAPDSYAATNAASSGAFVLSESYLYTTEMIKTTLQHLTDNGIMVVQFGELDFQGSPNRTSRYVVTARKALQELGVKDPNNHLLVAAQLEQGGRPLDDRGEPHPDHARRDRTGSSPASAEAPRPAPDRRPRARHRHQHRQPARVGHQRPGRLDRRRTRRRTSPRSPTTRPYFWHFNRFTDVITNITHPLTHERPRGRDRRTCAPVVAGDRRALRGRVPARTVLRGAQEVARAARPRPRRPCTSPRSGSASCSSRSR